MRTANSCSAPPVPADPAPGDCRALPLVLLVLLIPLHVGCTVGVASSISGNSVCRRVPQSVVITRIVIVEQK
ncbi:hypothetical protein [Streptomyces sp. NPDC056227]|uniref:hypothetical protein n=1 Tax=Streptomyces sp. NPDC056227 TaxID=3345753 RepID=UPI0035E32432